MVIWIFRNSVFLAHFNSFIPKTNEFLAISQTAYVNKQITKLMLNKARQKDTHFVVVPFLCPPERLKGENPLSDASAGVRLYYGLRYRRKNDKQ